MSRTLPFGLLFMALSVADAILATPVAAQARGARSTATRIIRGTVPERVSEKVEDKYKRSQQLFDAGIASRDFKVETAPPEKTKLFRTDPKLLENKFVATVALLTVHEPSDDGVVQQFDAATGSISTLIDVRQTDMEMSVPKPVAQRSGVFGSSDRSFGSSGERYPDDLVQLVHWDGQRLFRPGAYFGDPQLKLSEHLKLIVEHCKPEDRPAENMIRFFTSPDCERDLIRRHGYRIEKGRRATDGWEYLIYAPTAEIAEERAAALVKLLDGGLSRPMQSYLLAEGRKFLELARAKYEELASKSAAIKTEEEKLAKPSEISTDILTQLKAQKVMVAVELSGLNARVRACDEMLKDPKKLEISTLQSISDMKVKAEIERVGIKEKLDQINAYIGEGDSREATRNRIDSMNVTWNQNWNSARSLERWAATMAGLFDLYAPLPLYGNKITISPVEWTN